MPLIMAVPGHIQKIFSIPPLKSETRRVISYFKRGPHKGERVPPRRVGSLQQIRKSIFGESHGLVKILSACDEPLEDITEEQAWAEGGYGRDEYIAGFLQMNPKFQYVQDGEVKTRPRTAKDPICRYVFEAVDGEGCTWFDHNAGDCSKPNKPHCPCTEYKGSDE